jgi:Ni,Fe-hydrogenase III large subunit
MTLEESFGVRLYYVRNMVDGMARRLQTESWQFLPEYLETAKHELTTLVDMWADITAKRESEADQCPSK